MSLESYADQLESAIKSRRTIPSFSSASTGGPAFTLEAAYAIQEIGLTRALARGARLAGYKMGLTSRAKQRDVNVFEPISGYLLAENEFEPGAPVSVARWVQPRVEPEIAVTLRTPLSGENITLRDVVRALDLVCPALEILDSRYEAFSFQLPDVVADNASGAGFVLGNTNWAERLEEVPLLGVVVKKNGVIVQTGAPAAVFGQPLLSVVSLAKHLGRQGKRIEAGQVVLTGGITASVPFAKNDFIEIVWPGETLGFTAV